MDWYAKSVRRMRDPDYLRLPAELRGHHDALLALLAERERGPVLHGARKWSRRDWDRACAVTFGAITRLVEVGLASWTEDDLVVTDYDERGEELLRQKRKAGGKGAEERWSSHGTANGAARGAPKGAAKGTPKGAANAQDRTGRDGREQDELESAPAFALTHPDPPAPSAVTTLRSAWLAWFGERYGDDYAWRARDADDAAELVKLAGARGVDEVMRRAQILGAQKREKAITPAIVRMAWNEVAARPAPAKSDPLLDGMANGTIP